jgi:phytoene dehydrogenase-like protein
VAESKGVKIMTKSSVKEILMKDDGSVKGVKLDNGKEYVSDLVLSNCTPRVTFE